MTSEQLIDVLNEIDDEMIKETDEIRQKRQSPRRRYTKWIAVAACFCVVISGLVFAQKAGLFYRYQATEESAENIMENAAEDLSNPEGSDHSVEENLVKFKLPDELVEVDMAGITQDNEKESSSLDQLEEKAEIESQKVNTITVYDGDETIGKYPIITKEKAIVLLTTGKYIGTSNISNEITKDNIKEVTVVYCKGVSDDILLPYYRFYVSFSKGDDSCICYVPAIAEEHIINMPGD